jgi:phage tail-like protein
MSEPAPAIPLHAKPGYRSTAKRAQATLPDPVGELRFRVAIAGVEIGAFAECSGLSAEWEVFEYAEGGEHRFVHKFRDRLKYPNLVLKRGVTFEDELLKWFMKYGKESPRDRRGSVTVTLLGDDGTEVSKWTFAAAFPLKWQGPSFNAKSTNVAMETLEIGHQGLEVQD